MATEKRRKVFAKCEAKERKAAQRTAAMAAKLLHGAARKATQMAAQREAEFQSEQESPIHIRSDSLTGDRHHLALPLLRWPHLFRSRRRWDK